MFLEFGRVYDGQQLMKLGAKIYSNSDMALKEWRVQFGRVTYIVNEIESDKYKIIRKTFELNNNSGGGYKKYKRGVRYVKNNFYK